MAKESQWDSSYLFTTTVQILIEEVLGYHTILSEEEPDRGGETTHQPHPLEWLVGYVGCRSIGFGMSMDPYTYHHISLTPQDGTSGAAAHFALAGCLTWNSVQSTDDRSFGVHLVQRGASETLVQSGAVECVLGCQL